MKAKSEEIFTGIGSLETKFVDDAKFVKVFYHHESAGPFASETETVFSLVEGKFSVLKYVNEMLQYNGKYEMMIECPIPHDVSKYPKPGFVWWRQSEFPNVNMNTEVVNTYSDGFSLDPRSTWNVSSEGQTFTGLRKSSVPLKTFFDGISQSQYWFAIGLSESISNGIPCYARGSDISLWVRIPGYPITLRNNKQKHIIVLYVISSLC